MAEGTRKVWRKGTSWGTVPKGDWQQGKYCPSAQVTQGLCGTSLTSGAHQNNSKMGTSRERNKLVNKPLVLVCSLHIPSAPECFQGAGPGTELVLPSLGSMRSLRVSAPDSSAFDFSAKRSRCGITLFPPFGEAGDS